MSRGFLSRLLCLGLLLLAGSAAAQDYNSVVQRILEMGNVDGPFIYLEFREGGLRQYAVAEEFNPEVLRVSFVEEFWSRTGENDVIDQWIVVVTPYLVAFHREIVEHDGQVMAFRALSPEGAERVVQRIAEKTVGMDSPEH